MSNFPSVIKRSDSVNVLVRYTASSQLHAPAFSFLAELNLVDWFDKFLDTALYHTEVRAFLFF